MIEMNRNLLTGTENTFATVPPDLGWRRFPSHTAAIKLISVPTNSIGKGLLVAYLSYWITCWMRARKHWLKHSNDSPPRKVIFIPLVLNFTPGTATRNARVSARSRQPEESTPTRQELILLFP